MLNKNPWIGLASYDETIVKEGYLFCGRHQSVADLFAKIDNNICTTLYGKSGIGKTSLVQAGLFPKLRANGYLPVMLRLGLIEDGCHAKTVTDALKDAVRSVGGYCNGDYPECRPDDVSYLYRFFQSVSFFSANGKILFPVIVLDQFEELYFKGKKSVELLLRQLYLLVDDSSMDNSQESSDYANYRILISLREDDLFRLEDSVDQLRLQEMKYNRLRLVEFTDDEARSVILEPGRQLWSAEEAVQISDYLISKAKSEEDTINTAMLSLICSRLYDSAVKNNMEIVSYAYVSSFLESSDGNFLASFYNEIKRKLHDASKWYFLEDALITEDGRRKAVPESEFLKRVPDSSFLFDGEFSMLRYITISTQRERQVEIIHDALAKSMLGSRSERLLAETTVRQKRKNRIITAVTVVILGIMGIMGTQYVRIKKTQNQLYTAQSRFLTKEASKLIEEGDISKAVRLLLHALPKDLKHPDRPVVEEAEITLYEALSYKGTSHVDLDTYLMLLQPVYDLVDDRIVCTSLSSNAVFSYDIYTGKHLESYVLPDRHMMMKGDIDADLNRVAYVTYKEDTLDQPILEVKLLDYKMRELLYKRDCSIRTGIKFINDSVAILIENNKIEVVDYIKSIVSPIEFDSDIISYHIDRNKKYLSVVLENDIVKVIDVQDWDTINEFIWSESRDAVLNQDCSLMAIVDEKNRVTVMELASMQVISTIEAIHRVHHVAFNNDGNCLAIAMSDGSAEVYETSTGKMVYSVNDELSSSTKGIQSVAFIDEKNIVTFSEAHIRVWNNGTQENMDLHMNLCEEVISAFFSPADNRILAVTEDCCFVYNDNDINPSYGFPCGKGVSSAVLSPDGGSVLINDYYGDESLYVYDIETGALEFKYEGDIYSENAVFLPDGKTIVAGGSDGKVLFIDLATGKLIREVKVLEEDVFMVDASKDGQFVLAFSEFAGPMAVVSVTMGDEVTYLNHPDVIWSAVFSHDGTRIATIAEDDRIRIWDLHSGKVSRTIKNEWNMINAFSPDDRFLAVDNDFGGITVYDVDTGAIVFMNQSNNEASYVTTICFSDDGRYILTADVYGAIRKIEFNPCHLQDILDSYHNDSDHDWTLTRAEKNEYYLNE